MEICDLSTGCGRYLEIQMPPGSTLSLVSWNTRVIRVWHVCTLCLKWRIRSGTPPFTPPVCIFLCRYMAKSGRYHGNHLSLRWIPSARSVCNHRAFKSSQPEDLTVAHWEEEFTALQMNLWAREGEENREEGSAREIKKIDVIIGDKSV